MMCHDDSPYRVNSLPYILYFTGSLKLKSGRRVKSENTQENWGFIGIVVLGGPSAEPQPLFMSSAIHGRVGVEGVLVELAREVMSHVCAAVAIASQRRTSRRPLIGTHDRTDREIAVSARAFEYPLSQRQSAHRYPASKYLAWLSCRFPFSCIKKNRTIDRRKWPSYRATGSAFSLDSGRAIAR